MTDYTDFIRDFPTRCTEVLQLFYDQAKTKDREATLLIMAATAAFIIPFERLRTTSTQHPADDRGEFSEQAKCLDSALGRPFLGSPFQNDVNGSWSIGKKPRPQRVAFTPLPKQTPASQVLAILRNALAHGNLWTVPGSGSEIEAFVFWSEEKKNEEVIGYKYVRVSPTDLHSFLVKWCAFLKREKIPSSVVQETLAQAA